MKAAGHTGQFFGPRPGGSRPKAPHQARNALRLGLEARREEIEQALLARVYGIADPTEIDDFAYVEGLRSAASAAFEWALDTLESPDDRQPIPPALLSQARLAARNGVGLDTVLRRYTAGHALVVDFLIKEVEREGDLRPAELRRILAASSSAFDRLLAAVSEEYARELESRLDFSQERRRAERIERLLAGEPADVVDLPYDFGVWHLGIVAQGCGVTEQIRAISADLGCRALILEQREAIVWAWLGAREALDPSLILSAVQPHRDISIALGEPADELPGWRLTHRQAIAALPVALRGAEPVRYADVALIAAVLDNELLSTSLCRLYLDPLAEERDGGETLRQTLDAYFSAGRNLTSTAALIGVSRRTVSNRLQRVEQLIGRPCETPGGELATALRARDYLESGDNPTMAKSASRNSRIGHSSASQ